MHVQYDLLMAIIFFLYPGAFGSRGGGRGGGRGGQQRPGKGRGDWVSGPPGQCDCDLSSAGGLYLKVLKGGVIIFFHNAVISLSDHPSL